MTFNLLTWGYSMDLSRNLAWRKSLQLYVNPTWGVMFGWGEQVKTLGSGEWRDLHMTGYQVSLSRHFGWGHSHTYYDGPHCAFDVGFLHFLWHDWDCERCRA